jgi:flagellar hook-associated protein 2
MALSSPGIGSGLDVNAIVSSLMNVERAPLTKVAAQKTAFQSKVSAFGTLKSALSTFQSSLSALSSISKFNAQSIVSSNPSMFTATALAGRTAGLGNYDVTVSQLAKSQKLSVGGFANISDVVGTGTLTISFGAFSPAVAEPPSAASFTNNTAKPEITINIDSANNSLAGVRDAINASNSSVSASIVNDGTTNRLVITSKDTGEINGLKITVADDDADDGGMSGLSSLAYDPLAAAGSGRNMTQVQEAKNALLTVDGISIVKASNTITDVIEGVSLNLLTTSSSAVNLNVSTNQEAVKESINAFIEAFNKLDTSLRNLTKFDEAGKSSGALLGDSTARSVVNQIRAVLNGSIANGTSLNTLSQIGISFKSNGKLELNQKSLDRAFETNFNDIASLFATTGRTSDALVSFVGSTNKTQAGIYAIDITQLGSDSENIQGTINGLSAIGSGNILRGLIGGDTEGLRVQVNGGALGPRGTVTFTQGFAAQLDKLMTNLLSDDGPLATRTEGINSSIKRLDKQAEAIQVRLVSIEVRYRAQFTRLDTLLASMSSTSSYLSQQLAALNK